MENQQEAQKHNFWYFLTTIPLKVKIFLISFLILAFSIFLFKFSNDRAVSGKLEESRKRLEDKLKSISLYEGHIDGYQSEYKDIDKKIKVIKDNIATISTTTPEKTTLDNFFDERVK